MTEGSLRVWAIRNVPNAPTYQDVATPAEGLEVAKKWVKADLANPSIESNAFGMEIFEDGEWTEWYDDQGQSLDDLLDDIEEE
jgi:hypothetical protein